MTEPNFTPGKWKADYSEAGGAMTYVTDENNVLIADAFADSAQTVGIPEQSEAVSNAKLIAAAPEMYEALKHVLIASEDGGDMEDIDWQMLREVVKKAGGQ